MKKIFSIFLLISCSQCLPIEVEEVAAEPIPVGELILEHRMMVENPEPSAEIVAEVKMIEPKPEPTVVKEEKPVLMVAVVQEPLSIEKPLEKKNLMDAKPVPMAASLVEQPIVEVMPEPMAESMAALLVEQPMVEAMPKPMAALLVENPIEEVLSEPMAETMAALLAEQSMAETMPKIMAETMAVLLLDQTLVEEMPEPIAESMAALLVEHPMEEEMPEPMAETMAALLVKQPMVEAIPEAIEELLAEQMMMEDKMAQPLSVLMPESMSEPIIYNIIDDKNYYNHIQMGIPGEAVEGDFAFKADGNMYKTIYTADEYGYQAAGDHLPISPSIPNYPQLFTVENTDEVEALTQVHKHFVNIQNQLIDNTRNPVDSGVDVVRRRRTPVTVPQPNLYNYAPHYPLLSLQPIFPSLTYSQFAQPILTLAHPTYNLGLAFNLPKALVTEPLQQTDSEVPSPDLPNEGEDGEDQPAALAL